jgi:hypothetical protein
MNIKEDHALPEITQLAIQLTYEETGSQMHTTAPPTNSWDLLKYILNKIIRHGFSSICYSPIDKRKSMPRSTCMHVYCSFHPS